MGVKSFYKWLVQKYPKIVVQAMQHSNGFQFDNLYIDMNEIIHSCFRPDPSPPITFDEVFININDYIDHIFSIVRPRSVVFLSIDGVPPRGKMNQQRTRRFRTASDTELAEAEEQLLRKEFEKRGKRVLPKQEPEVSDSNAIAPGTEFMFLLSEKLQDYVTSRISNHPDWKNIMVILSDANVPGEGEHKMISFIRQQRTLPDYNPNTRHCLYGHDSDLIMFALATHELHLSILREELLSVRDPRSICMSDMQTRLDLFGSNTITTERELLQDYNNSRLTCKSYQFLHVWILREYLELDMQVSDPPENFIVDTERLIDDFIFLCFFVGNDFLPAIPSLQIYEDAIDLLMAIYKTEFKKLGGYLVDMEKVNDQHHDYVNLERVETFLSLIGTYEEMICQKRYELFCIKCKTLRAKSALEEEEEAGKFCGNTEFNISTSRDHKDGTSQDSILENTKELKETLKARLRQKYQLFRNGDFEADSLKPGTADWKATYYKKFSTQNSHIDCNIEEIVQKYMEALQWLLVYYFSEVPSWTWYYPYHYAPFASDMKGLTRFRVKLPRGLPFKPFDHLMAVLPPSSAQLLPKAYRKLMTDEKSNLMRFYPTELEIDTDGKHYKWQGICKLPFIDEELLFEETRKLENELEKHEVQRNMENVNKIFVRRSNMSESQLLSLVANFTSGRAKEINMENDILTLAFEFHEGSQHVSCPLPGVEFPEKSISEDDIKDTQLWHEIPVRKCRSRFQLQKIHKNVNYSEASASNGCAEDRYVSRFTKSSLDLTIHKVAGVGWAGRGARTGIATHKLPIGASSVTPSRDIYLSSNKAKGLK